MAAERGKKYVKTYKGPLTNKTVASLLAGFLGLGFPAFHRYYEEAKTSRVHPTRSVAVA